MQLEAIVLRNPSICRALNIVRANEPNTIVVTVHKYDDIDGKTWLMPGGGLIVFGTPAFDGQIMHVAQEFFGKRSDTDPAPNCTSDEVVKLLSYIWKFR